MSFYHKYLQEKAKTVLTEYFQNRGELIDDVFSQKAINNFLYYHEHDVDSSEKLVTTGNNKEPSICFKWVDSNSRVQLRGLRKLDIELKSIGSKPVRRFLSGEIRQPKTISLMVTAELFNAISEKDFNSLNKNEKRKLSVLDFEPTSRKEWQFWVNAAEKTTEMRSRIEIYLDGLTELPNHGHLIKNLAVAYYEVGRFDEAEKYLLKGIRVAPKDADMYSNYGLFLHEIQKDFDLAEINYEKAYKLNPKHVDNSLHYGYLLHTVRNEYIRAEEQYKIVLDLNPDSVGALVDYGLLLCFCLFNPSKGIPFFDRALELNPNDSTVLGNLALAYTTYELDFEKAEEYFRIATSLQPSSYLKQAYFAQLLFIKGKNDEALSCIDIAKKYANDDYETLLEIEFYLFAHYDKLRFSAEKNIKDYLQKGIKSELKNFTANIKAAIKQGHSDIDSLIYYARKISNMKYRNDGTLIIPDKKAN